MVSEIIAIIAPAAIAVVAAITSVEK